MSTDVISADTPETSKEDKVKIKLHMLFQEFGIEIHRTASRFQHENDIKLSVFQVSYNECEMLEERVLKIREYVEAMVFSEEVGDIKVPNWALSKLPKYYEGFFGQPTEGYRDIVRLFGLMHEYTRSMLTHECFQKIQDDKHRGWDEVHRIQVRSISDPAEFFYGYLQEIDASIAAAKLGIRKKWILEDERVHASNMKIIRKRVNKRLMQERIMGEDREFGIYPSATGQ
jgi:hypothetical protein